MADRKMADRKMADRKMADRKIKNFEGLLLFFCLTFFCPLFFRHHQTNNSNFRGIEYERSSRRRKFTHAIGEIVPRFTQYHPSRRSTRALHQRRVAKNAAG